MLALDDTAGSGRFSFFKQTAAFVVITRFTGGVAGGGWAVVLASAPVARIVGVDCTDGGLTGGVANRTGNGCVAGAAMVMVGAGGPRGCVATVTAGVLSTLP